jgi:hypothetical protein
MTDLLILMAIATSDVQYSPIGLYRDMKTKLGDTFKPTEDEFNLILIKLMEDGKLNCENMTLSLGIHGKTALCDQPILHFILVHMAPFRNEVDRLAKMRAANSTG